MENTDDNTIGGILFSSMVETDMCLKDKLGNVDFETTLNRIPNLIESLTKNGLQLIKVQ